MVFPKIDMPDRSYRYENLNSHQSVPFGSDLFGLRPEWISSFHSDASAQRSRGTVPRSDVRFEISPGRLWASGDFRRVASDQSLRPARTHDSRTDHREHSLVHSLMSPAGIGLAVFVTILWGFVSRASVRRSPEFLSAGRHETASVRRPVGISSATANKSSNENKHMKNILLIQSSREDLSPILNASPIRSSMRSRTVIRIQQSLFVIWPRIRCRMSGLHLLVRFRLSRRN